MKESLERIVKLGLKKTPKTVFDEVDRITADMVRKGWQLKETLTEDNLEKIHLFFEKQLSEEQ